MELENKNLEEAKKIIKKKMKKYLLLSWIPFYAYFAMAKIFICIEMLNQINNKESGKIYNFIKKMYSFLSLTIIPRVYNSISSNKEKLEKTLGVELEQLN